MKKGIKREVGSLKLGVSKTRSAERGNGILPQRRRGTESSETFKRGVRSAECGVKHPTSNIQAPENIQHSTSKFQKGKVQGSRSKAVASPVELLKAAMAVRLKSQAELTELGKLLAERAA